MNAMPVRRRVIALDGDGVLIDYHAGYVDAWERAFGERLTEVDPLAYWVTDRYGVRRLVDASELEHFRRHMNWRGMPALPGAIEACRLLDDAGYELVCVTALEEHFGEHRRHNLKVVLDLPISRVYATGQGAARGLSPKLDVIAKLKPVAFVDDLAEFFRGIPAGVHKALVMGGPSKTPNCGSDLLLADTRHSSLLDFACFWIGREQQSAAGTHAAAPALRQS